MKGPVSTVPEVAVGMTSGQPQDSASQRKALEEDRRRVINSGLFDYLEAQSAIQAEPSNVITVRTNYEECMIM